MIALSRVRSSWVTLARKLVLARSALCAWDHGFLGELGRLFVILPGNCQHVLGVSLVEQRE